jgi:hypothetical protein
MQPPPSPSNSQPEVRFEALNFPKLLELSENPLQRLYVRLDPAALASAKPNSSTTPAEELLLSLSRLINESAQVPASSSHFPESLRGWHAELLHFLEHGSALPESSFRLAMRAVHFIRSQPTSSEALTQKLDEILAMRVYQVSAANSENTQEIPLNSSVVSLNQALFPKWESLLLQDQAPGELTPERTRLRSALEGIVTPQDLEQLLRSPSPLSTLMSEMQSAVHKQEASKLTLALRYGLAMTSYVAALGITAAVVIDSIPGLWMGAAVGLLALGSYGFFSSGHSHNELQNAQGYCSYIKRAYWAALRSLTNNEA